MDLKIKESKMVEYSIVKYSAIYYDIWNDFLEHAKNATFLFHRNFMEYHNEKFTDHSLLIFKNKTLIALFPANQVEDKICSHQGLTYGGLIFKDDLKFRSVLKCFTELLSFLEHIKIHKLELKLLPNIYTNYPNEELLYIMFLLDAKLMRRDALSVVNLEIPEKFSKNRLEGCKRAEKNKLVIKDDDIFDQFWNTILIPNLNNKHNKLPVHSLEEIKYLKSKFPDNIKQYNVYNDNVLVAGTTMFITKTVAHSQYIASDINKSQLGSLDFLHSYLIKNVFKNKKYFDFGISNENNGRQINKGLQYWKEGFGARTITQDFYSLDLKHHKKLNDVLI